MPLTNEKVLDLVKKLFAQAASENEIGNEGASISFAEKARDLLKTYHLENPIETVEEARIGKTILTYPFYRQNARIKERVIWFEELAKVVAEANFCKIEITLDGGYYNGITREYDFRESKLFIIGTDLDREVAVYIFNRLSELSYNSCKFQMNLAKQNVGIGIGVDFRNPNKKVASLKEWPGDDVFIENFHKGFREAISASFKEKKAIGSNGNSNEDFDEIAFANDYHWKQTPEELIQDIGRKLGTVIHSKVADKPINEIRETITSSHVGDIYFLVDCSGSMSDFDKMGQARRGVIDYSEKMIEQNYRMGFIKFGAFAEHVTEPLADLERVKSLVNKFDCVGSIANSTKLKDAIQQSMFHFTNFRVRRIICIVTDGHCWDSIEALEMAEQAKQTGIEIMTIGTEDADLEFLKKLSSKPKLALKAKSSELESGIRELAGLLN